jgi:hypothetical protein
MTQQAAFALAYALVFVHGPAARDEVERHQARYRDATGVPVKAPWGGVAGILPPRHRPRKQRTFNSAA